MPDLTAAQRFPTASPGRDGLAVYLSAATSTRLTATAERLGCSLQFVLRHALYLLLDEAANGGGPAPPDRAACRHTIQTTNEIADVLRALATGYGWPLSEYLRHGVAMALDRIEEQ